MKRNLSLLIASLALCAAAVAATAQPEEQLYVLDTELVAAQADPTIVKEGEKYVVVMQRTDKVWVKYTMTPLVKPHYPRAHSNLRVVRMTDIIPNP